MLKTKQKLQAGFTIIELLIVIAIIGILALLVLNNFQGAQAKARDTQRRTDINNVHGKLEEFYNENGGYPNEDLTITLLPGMDAGSLADADGAAMAMSFSTGAAAASSVGNTNEYQYAGFNCTAAVSTPLATPATCAKYVLRTYIERPASGQPNLFEKNSLN